LKNEDPGTGYLGTGFRALIRSVSAINLVVTDLLLQKALPTQPALMTPLRVRTMVNGFAVGQVLVLSLLDTVRL
jgi:hypothetical protein